MKRYILACLTVAVVFTCSLASVKADDLYQPPWLRGSAGTTFQAWDFATSGSPNGRYATPDAGYYNPYGTPSAAISYGIWSAFYDNHVGVWTCPYGMGEYFTVPNTTDDNPYKYVWTQITWQSDNGGSPDFNVSAGGSTSETWLESVTPVGNGDWMQSVYLTLLSPNPSSEVVSIQCSYEPGSSLAVGQVVIDTLCTSTLIPEPSSLALLAMGAIGLSYASRKRKD